MAYLRWLIRKTSLMGKKIVKMLFLNIMVQNQISRKRNTTQGRPKGAAAKSRVLGPEIRRSYIRPQIILVLYMFM